MLIMRDVIKTLWLPLFFLLPAAVCFAQEEEAWAQYEEPLETQIVGREWAGRLRLETSVTADREDLLKEDPAYRYVPSRIFAADLRFVSRRRITIGGWAERWETEQDAESRRYGGLMILPIRGSWSSRVRLVRFEQDGSTDRNYAYLTASGMLTTRIFSSTEYQYTHTSGRKDAHQIYEYLGWTVHPRLRLGGYGNIRYDGDTWDVWCIGGMATVEPVLEWTTVRAEVRTGGGDKTSDYTEVRGAVYQRVWGHIIVRPDVRYYRDEDDRESYAYGVKLLAYLTPALDVQLGYRYYTQNQGGDFNTATLGLGLLF